MTTALDTNVLSDLLSGDEAWSAAASRELQAALERGLLVVCPVVRAELATGFGDTSGVSEFLADLGAELVGFSEEALDAAGGAWRAYSRRRQTHCPSCGREVAPTCEWCRSPIVWRQHVLADFLIGAHALVQADALMTRDQGYYRAYFPTLKLIVPAVA